MTCSILVSYLGPRSNRTSIEMSLQLRKDHGWLTRIWELGAVHCYKDILYSRVWKSTVLQEFDFCFSNVASHSSHHYHICICHFYNIVYIILLSQDQPDDEPDKLSNRVFQFDPSKDRWTECSRMKYSRYRCGSAVLNGEIYILGQTTMLTATVLLSILYGKKNDASTIMCVFFRWYRM